MDVALKQCCNDLAHTQVLSFFGASFPGPAFCRLQVACSMEKWRVGVPEIWSRNHICTDWSYSYHCYTHGPVYTGQWFVWLFSLGNGLVYICSLFDIM